MTDVMMVIGLDNQHHRWTKQEQWNRVRGKRVPPYAID